MSLTVGIIAFWTSCVLLGLLVNWLWQRAQIKPGTPDDTLKLLHVAADTLLQWLDIPKEQQANEEIATLHAAMDAMICWDGLPSDLRAELLKLRLQPLDERRMLIAMRALEEIVERRNAVKPKASESTPTLMTL